MVTEQTRRQIVRERPGGGDDCVAALSRVFEHAPVQDFSRAAKLRAPHVFGDRATIIATSSALQPGQRTVIKLVKDGGDWEVDVLAGGVKPAD